MFQNWIPVPDIHRLGPNSNAGDLTKWCCQNHSLGERSFSRGDSIKITLPVGFPYSDVSAHPFSDNIRDMSNRAWLEEINYDRDPRVRARDNQWYSSFEEERMVATIQFEIEDEETGDDVEISCEVPVRFEVCTICSGRGKHVNPSIDCGGLTQEDFRDASFKEDYFSGVYDVTCYACDGKRVTPEINKNSLNEEQKKVVALMNQRQEDDAYFESISRAERRMGA